MQARIEDDEGLEFIDDDEGEADDDQGQVDDDYFFGDDDLERVDDDDDGGDDDNDVVSFPPATSDYVYNSASALAPIAAMFTMAGVLLF